MAGSAELALPVLRVDELNVVYRRGGMERRAVQDVSFSLRRGEVMGLVGESGSGKTSIAMSILGLLPHGSEARGSITMGDRNLLQLKENQLRELLGRQVGFVPQSPAAALTPVLTIGFQMCEAVRAHRRCSKEEARQQALQALVRVGVGDGKRILRQYPHQISGGTAQRVLIAIALLHDPEVIVADEPTSALDATVQRQILDLLAARVRDLDVSLLVISHDFGVVAALADQVTVLYSGRVIESGDAPTVLSAPSHPYTVALLSAAQAIPTEDPDRAETGARDDACAYAPRCARARADCRSAVPQLASVAGDHRVRCLHPLSELSDERR